MRTNATEATNYNTRLRRHYKPDDCSTEACMRERYCIAMNLDIYESDQCRNLSHFDFTRNFWGSLYEYMQGPWVDFTPYTGEGLIE